MYFQSGLMPTGSSLFYYKDSHSLPVFFFSSNSSDGGWYLSKILCKIKVLYLSSFESFPVVLRNSSWFEVRDYSGRAGRPYWMLGIKFESVACKANALPILLLLWALNEKLLKILFSFCRSSVFIFVQSYSRHSCVFCEKGLLL